MTTRISSIRIIDNAQNRTYTCQFPSETFHETTISELQLQLKKIMGVAIRNQRLVFDYEQLKAEGNGREMTFGDYDLRDGDDVSFCLPLMGGGGSGFLPLRFADLSSEDNFREVKLINDGLGRLTIARGINFQGTCRNRFCQAKNEIVSIQRGFYDSTGGTCMLNYEITQLECPMCKQTLDKDEINGVGVYKAKLQVKSKEEGSIEAVVNIEARDKFLYAGCMDDRDKVEYEYVILKVTRF